MFITFEGIEGSGKTTQVELLGGYLERKGMGCTLLREPGGTELGEQIRNILLAHRDDAEPIEPWAELFLYSACRVQLVERVIKPALNEKRLVLCDRFTDSTLAYQGYGRGIELSAIEAINRHSSCGLVPDLTILIDCPVEVGLKRARARQEQNRFEQETLEFHRRVRRGYLELARREPQRIKIVDGRAQISDIHRAICDIIDRVI